MFNFIKNLASLEGYKALRLYTDEIDNAIAVLAYKSYDMFMEEYTNPNDLNKLIGKILIFSIPLNNNPLTPWENKLIYLREEYENVLDYKIKTK